MCVLGDSWSVGWLFGGFAGVAGAAIIDSEKGIETLEEKRKFLALLIV